MLNTHDDDPCCARALSKALRLGDLDHAVGWDCPKCGMHWKPELFHGPTGLIRHWTPRPVFGVAQLRKYGR